MSLAKIAKDAKEEEEEFRIVIFGIPNS